MPELPEVETVRRGLEKIFATDNVIKKIELQRPNLRTVIPVTLPVLLRGEPVLGVRRRAKYLLIDTPKNTLISHLGMSGSWRVAAQGEELLHDHVYITMTTGTRLAFNDPRRFGILDLAPRSEVFENRWLKHLGVEPFADEFTAELLLSTATGKTVPVKNFLMDQKVVVGVGNIYVSEALFKAGVKPLRAANKIHLKEWKAIVKTVQSILQKSIERGGTTLRDHRAVSGEAGAFQQMLQVYGREGDKCRKCKKLIFMKVVAGRSTYWCNSCQK